MWFKQNKMLLAETASERKKCRDTDTCRESDRHADREANKAGRQAE